MKTAVVVCPGRGTYNKGELGYLARHFPDRALIADFDAKRLAAGQATLSDLDGAERYSGSVHTRGDNASALIYAATIGDFVSIDRELIEVVAVTGNSMGWYSAVACGGALSVRNGFVVANTMGALMQEALIGGQTVYPSMGEEWRPDPGRRSELLALVESIASRDGHFLTLSIDLGGMLVVAGNEPGLSAFEKSVDRVDDRFPMRLGNHAAFHSSLQEPVAEEGRKRLPSTMFVQPDLPLIDGRGAIWWPNATDTDELWNYTLGAQVTQTYDFTRALTVAAREFAPDMFIITGPGTTLGGALAQSLILAGWLGMSSKEAFRMQQEKSPVLAAMGLPAQRMLVSRS